MHSLLTRQLDKVDTSRPEGVHALLELVDLAYCEYEQDQKRTDRSTHLMAEELEEINTQLEASAETISVQNMRFQAALDNMPQGLSLFDRDGHLVVCNRRFEEMYQLPSGFIVTGRSLADILAACAAHGPDDDMGHRLLTLQHVAMSVIDRSTLEQTWPDGRIISIARSALKDGGYLDTISDITDSRRAMARIAHMARYDALTDLPNRSHFNERLHDASHHAARGELCAVLCLDLDRFKAVNDTLGHPVGDALLIEVSHRLRAGIRDIDTAARFGGDEFAIILRQLKSTRESHDVAQRLVNSLCAPYVIQGHNVSIGTSIGVAIMDTDHTDLSELMRNADVALYKAKADGRGRFQPYVAELSAQLDQRRDLERDLRDALAKQQFELHLQPQVDTIDGTTTGFEALLRWRCPARGLLMPADFLPLCEELNLMDEIGGWALKTACLEATHWPEHMRVAVNISPSQFKAGKLVTMVLAALEASDISPSRLELEIAERFISGAHPDMPLILNQLKQLNVRVTLDDFGQTGSLRYIRELPFDRVKIDPSYIHELGTSRDSRAVVRAVTSLCVELGMDLTAEGVETQDQLDILKAEHCLSAQGYWLGTPLETSVVRQQFAIRRKINI